MCVFRLQACALRGITIFLLLFYFFFDNGSSICPGGVEMNLWQLQNLCQSLYSAAARDRTRTKNPNLPGVEPGV